MMGNKRFQSHPGSGAKTGQKGSRHDTVAPIKTKNWPGLPGKAQSGSRNQGFPKKRQGASEKGL